MVLIKGIKSFTAPKKEWPHPIAIIGQGYNGLKTAIGYLMDNNTNLVCLDQKCVNRVTNAEMR